ncbi:molybdopterin-dependent oxidoreductase [Massilia sp. CCM 9210]|uniref:molybdopterin-dependent oxidoreductase n=1 Tax=Massilia scottii TaxID=3057166 RepID=UPI00279691A4|nr:molybdopterin-dependent oxidoreductase [Massilia sp. CCM 9210]MDQ1815098.1 molybdopterin-dependent oxidoreductase [Massilia sp. CCM 9210]
MKKRHFLGAAASAAALPALAAGTPARQAPGPALLTLTGELARSNRGPFDPVLDQMMHKQKISFDKAFGLDFGALLALPAVGIRPTLEYDAKPHALRGPLLLDVVAASGTRLRADGKLVLRAVDGYAVALPVAQARAQRFIVATHLDGKPMALGGLGPLWAVYDADRFPDMAARPVAERFGACPWALYHIEVAQ